MSSVLEKAAEVEQLLASVQARFEAVRKAAVAKACVAEVEKLQSENIALKTEVEILKRNLILAEAKNGIKQVRLPFQKTVTQSATAVSSKPSVDNNTADKAATASEKNVQAKGNKNTATVSQGEKAPKESKKEKQPPKVDEGKKEKAVKAEDGKKDKQVPKVEESSAGGDAESASETVDVSRLDMRVGFIVNAKKHPDADALYVEEVDVGEGKIRTVVSGLVKHIPLEQLLNRHAIFLCNLKPAKLKGIASEAMIMCASTPEKVEIINPPENAVRGDRIIVDEYPGTPDAQLNPKKKTWEQIQPNLRIDENGAATYKGAAWKIKDKGLCLAPTMKNCPIK